MENSVNVVSEEEETSAANDATPAIATGRALASEEMEPGTETSNHDDVVEQDDDFGDFAAAASSDVAGAEDEHGTLEPDTMNQNKSEENNDTMDEDFGEFESTTDNNGSHVIQGSDVQQASPPDAFDDPSRLAAAENSDEGGGVGEEVSNADETVGEDKPGVSDFEQQELIVEASQVHVPIHSLEDSETETKNGIGTNNVPESSDSGELETPQDNTILPLGDSEEQQVDPAPVDVVDDPFAHLSTQVDETSCVSNNQDTEGVNAIISDSPGEVSPDNDEEFYSTHPLNDNSENGVPDSDGVESETGNESSSPDNDAGYFSAVTNEGEIQMNEPSVSPETLIPASTDTEEIVGDDNDHSAAESKMGTASIIEQPGVETFSSTSIDSKIEIAEDDHIDPPVDETDGFRAFEQVAVDIAECNETQADNTEISDDIAVTAGESELPEITTETVIAGEVITADGAIDADDVDDDDFGDFGSFEKAESAPVEVANDSAAPDIAPSENDLAAGDDDDFGDFGSFEVAEAKHEALQASVPPQVQENDEDEDFGDFGDFTEFSSEAPAQQEKSSSVSGAGLSTVENEAQAPATNLLDPIVSKAEIIFKEVFARENIPSEDDQHASERVVVKVTSPLAELGTATVSEDPSTWLVDSIAPVMRGVEHLDKSGPTAIVNESSDYPYAHFTVPVCGLPLTKVDISGRSSQLPRKKSQDGIAFTESQDYSVGASFSADTEASAEPPSARSPVTQQSAGTVVNLPPLKSDTSTNLQNGSGPIDDSFADFQSSNDDSEPTRSLNTLGTESNGKKETLSSSAKQFLQQIPDLSFMLKPTLSLPKKS